MRYWASRGTSTRTGAPFGRTHPAVGDVSSSSIARACRAQDHPRVNLDAEYARQATWRDWTPVYESLPSLAGSRVLDLGCGIGAQARDLARRGARVVGIDGNEGLLEAARARSGHETVEFRHGDLRVLPQIDAPFDGLWSSFTAAYFVDFAPVLRLWLELLRPGGWIALAEVDDLFAHAPLAASTRELLDAYADESRAAGRYDFRMGRRLREELEAAGCEIASERNLGDRELAFDGPASSEVVESWRARFERMPLLRARCGASYASVRDEFLACLTRAEHRSQARVVVCIARRARVIE